MELMYFILFVIGLTYCLGKYLKFVYLLNIDSVSFTILTVGLIISLCRFVYHVHLFNNGYKPVYKECIWSHPNYEDCMDYFAQK